MGCEGPQRCPESGCPSRRHDQPPQAIRSGRDAPRANRNSEAPSQCYTNRAASVAALRASRCGERVAARSMSASTPLHSSSGSAPVVSSFQSSPTDPACRAGVNSVGCVLACRRRSSPDRLRVHCCRGAFLFLCCDQSTGSSRSRGEFGEDLGHICRPRSEHTGVAGRSEDRPATASRDLPRESQQRFEAGV
jgi:hypothetical protein